jgi:hypothetical protein
VLLRHVPAEGSGPPHSQAPGAEEHPDIGVAIFGIDWITNLPTMSAHVVAKSVSSRFDTIAGVVPHGLGETAVETCAQNPAVGFSTDRRVVLDVSVALLDVGSIVERKHNVTFYEVPLSIDLVGHKVLQLVPEVRV